MSPRYEYAGSGREPSSSIDYQSIAKGLGWFSIALGLAETIAPRGIAGLIGVRYGVRDRTFLRSPLFGPRELAAGIGILTQSKRAGWLWGRVAGDALDVSALASALTFRGNDRVRIAAAMAAVLGVTALDCACAVQLTQAEGFSPKLRSIRKSVWVNRPRSEAFSFWRRFENLPRFMQHLETVEELGNKRSRWRARGPFGSSFEWQSVIEREAPDSLISWKSVEDAEVENSGTVHFEPGPGERGTIVHVELRYRPPAGEVGRLAAKFLGKSGERMLEDSLRNFKQILETGEIIRSDASIHPGMHPARPPLDRRGAALAPSVQH
jgi:uncharacterized membrane protein